MTGVQLVVERPPTLDLLEEQTVLLGCSLFSGGNTLFSGSSAGIGFGHEGFCGGHSSSEDGELRCQEGLEDIHPSLDKGFEAVENSLDQAVGVRVLALDKKLEIGSLAFQEGLDFAHRALEEARVVPLNGFEGPEADDSGSQDVDKEEDQCPSLDVKAEVEAGVEFGGDHVSENGLPVDRVYGGGGGGGDGCCY